MNEHQFPCRCVCNESSVCVYILVLYCGDVKQLFFLRVNKKRKIFLFSPSQTPKKYEHVSFDIASSSSSSKLSARETRASSSTTTTTRTPFISFFFFFFIFRVLIRWRRTLVSSATNSNFSNDNEERINNDYYFAHAGPGRRETTLGRRAVRVVREVCK